MSATQWDPAQYNRFASEREQPFWDLASLVRPVPGGRVVDLGCGDGRLTSELHGRLGAGTTTGIDSSPAMLAAAAVHAGGGVAFEEADIATWSGPPADLVFANAALQWVPDHEAVLRRWMSGLADGGQLAVQMPANADHHSHAVARELGAEWLGEQAPADPVSDHVRAPEWYAELLDRMGFQEQHVRLQVYGHRLASSAEVVEWVKGTSLTRFKAIMTSDRYDQFLAAYRQRLVDALGDRRPYFYAFKRILLWAR